MSDIKLFNLIDGKASEVPGTAIAMEKSLQTVIEKNLESLLGIRFLASEHDTGPKHGGRIDTLFEQFRIKMATIAHKYRYFFMQSLKNNLLSFNKNCGN